MTNRKRTNIDNYNKPQQMIFQLFLLWRKMAYIIWAPSSEFVSSSIPSWQILTAHAQPLRGARDLVFCLKVPLDSLLVSASRQGSGETAHPRSLAWTFAARIGDKYQIRLTRSIWSKINLEYFITTRTYRENLTEKEAGISPIPSNATDREHQCI